MHPLLTAYIIAFVIMLAIVILGIRGRLINWFYALCVIVDAFKDVACQLYIDVRGKQEKEIELDEHENFWS